MSEPSVFERIVAGELPAQKVFENERILGIVPLQPFAPIHFIVFPKSGDYANVTELAAGDPQLLAELVAAAKSIADEHNGGEYRLIFNNGAAVGQTVFHVHAHVIGGDLEAGL